MKTSSATKHTVSVEQGGLKSRTAGHGLVAGNVVEVVAALIQVLVQELLEVRHLGGAASEDHVVNLGLGETRLGKLFIGVGVCA